MTANDEPRLETDRRPRATAPPRAAPPSAWSTATGGCCDQTPRRARPRPAVRGRARHRRLPRLGATAVRGLAGPHRAARPRPGPIDGAVAFVQYAKPRRNLESTTDRLHLFLALGILGGTGLAFLAGFAVARRAMRPIAGLTRAAREVARTRDPAAPSPTPPPTTRWPSWPRRWRTCCASSTPPAARPSTRCSASASSWPTPRTSCARRSPASWPTSSCSRTSWRATAARATARPPGRSRARRCAPRAGCGGWWATCCCSPAPTPAARRRGGRSTWRRWCARPPARPRRWPPATRCSSTSPPRA